MSSAAKKSRKPQLTVRTEAQPSVIARLQGLFPASPDATSGFPSDTDRIAQPIRPSILKVRILTWNMHDSIPKGDLEELLLKVPTYTPPTNPSSPPQFPHFNADADHPYHLILVAGQECPSTSGIPMGLGAGFKLMEDKDKDEKIRSSKHSHSHSESIKSKRSTSMDDSAQETPGHNAGWTAMVEDWLCHGGVAARATSPTTSDISVPKQLSPRVIPKEPTMKKGPYQLLCKERLLGIYLAMYIHRDLKPFVESTSKAFVPAGILGGRWGNKGGVGISAKIDGKSFLFMNCHLAAQVDKANLHDRLNNYNKIKAELAVDDFLSSDDPRLVSEDLTDRFDYTFVFGDLNFRLDISRLHADWLISRQDYAQALAFDQLKCLMENGRAFVGFNEGNIEFPPTFKYDVLRTLKRHKHGTSSKRLRYEKSRRLTEVEEKDLNAENEVEHEEEDGEKESDGEGEGEGGGEGEGEGEGEEAASLASSAWTSMNSRAITDQEQEDEYFDSTPNMVRSTSAPGSRASLALAAHKAKTKWRYLLSPTAPPSPTKWLKRPSFLDQQQSSSSTRLQKRKATQSVGDLKLDKPSNSEASPDANSFHTPHRSIINSSKSHQSDDDDLSQDDRGVYDSSHKKRVPSWCDRILFKSTVHPDPELELDESENPVRTRTKMGQFFVNALRPLSSRSRRESYSSLSSLVHSVTSSVSTHTSATATPKGDATPIHSPDLLEQVAPFSKFVYDDSRPFPPHTSAEVTTTVADPPSLQSEIDSKLRRSSSSSSSRRHSKPRTPERNPRRASSSAPIPAPIPLTSSSHSNVPRDPPVSTSSKWRFFPFLHSSISSNSSDVLTTFATKVPRKGDVVCLSYDTLDDRGMRRLEGRSDHRPVIGSYAVYL